MKLPEGFSDADACALLCGYGTSHHALKQRASCKPGETLCVLGAAGATGLAAVQIGKAMGATRDRCRFERREAGRSRATPAPISCSATTI